MSLQKAKFRVGQIIHHKLFDYDGVVFDVDPSFQGSELWYERMARSRPPKDEPWYHVLVHNAAHTTYVAEQNLETADEPHPITHPLTNEIFSEFDGSNYRLGRHLN